MCVYQCFSTLSLNRNPMQQFLLFTEPVNIVMNLFWGHSLKGQNSRLMSREGVLEEGTVSSDRKSIFFHFSIQFNGTLDAASRTLRIRGTPVEKHWCMCL